MSEVKRYFWNADNLDGFGYGSMDSLADASSQELVCASDYDAALAREAALLEGRDALQQRLTDAEKLLGDWYAANAAGGILVADEDYHLVTATAEMLEQASQKEGEGS